MTEPTRDALHAETLAWLKHVEVSAGYDAAEYIEDSDVREPAIQRMLLAEYAAACVRLVPELEAEVKRLRAECAALPAVTDAMVEAAIAEFCSQTGDSYAMLMANASDEDKAEMRDDWRHILTAALAARGDA